MSDKLKYALILDLKGNFARMTASAQKAMNRFAQTGEAGLKRMAKAMPAVGSALDKLGNRYTALISGGTMYAAVKSAAAMETRLTRLGITADKSNEEMRKLNEEIYKIAQNRSINVSADSIISGMEQIVAKTGDFDAAAENIKNLGLVISATGASGEDAGAMIADLIEKFGIKTPKELLETWDLLASQGKAGSFELKDLATQGNRVMSAYAGIGRTGKTATTELGTLMQIIRKGVGSSEQAATALEAYMRALNDVQTRERLKNSGISLFEADDPKKMRSAVEIMKDVIAKANGDISKIGQVFISSEAMRAFSAAALEFQKTKTFGSLDSFMNVNADGTALIGDSERMAATFEAPRVMGDRAELVGTAPASEMQGYALEVSGYSGGRGHLALEYAGYQPCHDAKRVVAETAYDPRADVPNTPDSVFCSHGAGYNVPWDEVDAHAHVTIDEARLRPWRAADASFFSGAR